MLRTPVLPFDAWLQWTSLAGPAGGSLEDGELPLREGLRSYLTPVVLEGLHLASPSLAAAIPDWLADPDTRASRAVESSLVAYFTRLAGRPTPFGAFSAVSLGAVGEKTCLSLSDGECRRKITLGLPYLRRLASLCSALPEARVAARFSANPTVHAVGCHAHYLQRVDARGGTIAFRAAVCKFTPALAAALAAADTGASIEELVSRLLQGSGEERSHTHPSLRRGLLAFVERLIETQILLPVTGPPLVGSQPVRHFIDGIRGIDALNHVTGSLERVTRQMEELASDPLGAPPERYQALADGLPAVDGPALAASDLFFVNLTRPAPRLSLGKEVAGEILEGVQLLRGIAAESDTTLQRFAQAFASRFAGREVPLLDVFDSDFDFSFGQRQPGREWKARDAHLLRKALDAVRAGDTCVQLSHSDIALLRNQDSGELPAGFAVVGALLAGSDTDVAGGNYRVAIDGIGRAAGILGRFASNDPILEQKLAAFVCREQEALDDAVLADVVYEPPGVAASNVLCRPALTTYVIPFFGAAWLPEERHIRLADLAVSIRGGRVVLRSTRLDREVLPVQNSSYGFHHDGNPPALRFLCRLAMGSSNVAWIWSDVFESFPFLPRLEHGRLVVARARWALGREEIQALSSLHCRDLMRGVERLRKDRGLPRFVSLTQAARRLPVDLANVLSVRMLLGLVRDESRVILTELLPGPRDLCVRGSQGSFQHEFVLPAAGPRQPRTPSPSHLAQDWSAAAAQRLFPPVSEWMYVKIYARPPLLDDLLAGPVAEMARALADAGLARDWFFIRYNDPYSHLRVRFRLAAPEHAGDALLPIGRRLNAALEEGLLWNWQVHSYDRETDRYGGPHGMEPAEAVFCADSALVLEALESFSSLKEREESRLALCIASLDALLADFDLSLSERHEAGRALWSRFTSRVTAPELAQRQFGRQFRADRHAIFGCAALLAGKMRPAFENRSRLVRPQAALLRRLCEQSILTQPLPSLIQDFAHLNVNRLGNAADGKDELKVYDCLRRLYASSMARRAPELFESYATTSRPC